MSPGCGNADDACTPEGRYANYFEIGHNAFEFVFDFGQAYAEENAEEKKTQFHTRIIMGPAYANALLDTLPKAIDQYIESFGPIPERDNEGHGDAR